MADQDFATISATKVHRSDFAYAPEGSSPSEWKLPIHDANHVRNALARFNQTELPAAAKPAALAKIYAAAKKFGIEVSPASAGRQTASVGAILPARLRGQAQAGHESPLLSEVHSGLVKIAVAYTGDFESNGKKFSISPKDLEDMAWNLSQRETPIDYEHLSAAQGPPGWARAAGWLRKPAGIEDFVGAILPAPAPAGGQAGHESPLREGKILWAWTEFTPVALAMIKQKEYRYFSPEIHWKEKDETGEEIGTRLAAGALTNRPFLKDLPPIEISDTDYQGLFGLAARHDGKLAAVRLSERTERLVSLEQIHVPGALRNISVAYPQGDGGDIPTPVRDGAAATKEKKMAKKFAMKKLTGGEHAGHVGIFDGNNLAGYVTAGEAKECMNSFDGDADDGGGADGNAKKMAESVLLVETFKDGRVDRRKAAALCDEGKLQPGSVFRAQDAEATIDDLIRAGKILPKRRAEAFRMALEHPEELKALLSDARPVVDTKSRGNPEGQGPGGSEELTLKVRQYAKEKNVPLSVALTEFTKTDEGQRLWVEHTREIVTAIETAEEEP